MDKRWILQEDLVIPKGTVFTHGPARRTYGGSNIDALIELSPDETGEITLYIGEPAADALFEPGGKDRWVFDWENFESEPE